MYNVWFLPSALLSISSLRCIKFCSSLNVCKLFDIALSISFNEFILRAHESAKSLTLRNIPCDAWNNTPLVVPLELLLLELKLLSSVCVSPHPPLSVPLNARDISCKNVVGLPSIPSDPNTKGVKNNASAV